MSDKLEIQIDSQDAEVAARNLDRLISAVQELGKAFEKTRGAASAIKELRQALVGIEGGGSAFAELSQAIKGLNSSAESLQKTFRESIGDLGTILKMEMDKLSAVVQTSGARLGVGLAEGIDDGTATAVNAVKRQGRTIAAAAKAEATRIYEAMVAGQPNAKIKDVGALFKLQEAGATLSPYHKQVLENWKKSSNETYRALKAQMAAENAQIAQAAKEAAADLQQKVKAATIAAANSETAYSSLSTGKTYNMAKYMLDQIYPPKALFEAEAARRQKELDSTLKQIQRQVAAATNSAVGPYQKYNPNTGVAGSVVNAVPKSSDISNLDRFSASLKQLTLDGNDTHSMLRGLASGFNLLWLTWGNLGPLFVGAAISNGFMQTAKTGMQVAHTMETIAVLGGNTAEQIQALNIELDRLGKTGPFGPVEVADAMKVLSLAGLKANEILSVTQDVLNFSVAGTTDLKTAADTLVSISTAFGMGAEGFGRVADVVSKAAAESKTSVESFAAAMKTASVINKQYGVSLEDTATGLAALSQIGIEGTAAGTALRNMYADLSGRSQQVAKVLKAQGIEMRTATGEFRPMLEVVADLTDKLNKLDGIGQKNLLQAILSERGAKGMVELLQLITAEAKDMGKGFSNALEELRTNIDQSYGFAAVSAAKLAQTADQQFKAVGATLSTSMNQAFRDIEPTLLLVADALKQAFGSEQFITGIKSMTSTIAELALSFIKLTSFILENWKAVGLAMAAYVAVTRTIKLKAAATAEATAATIADTAATIANNRAKAGAGAAVGTLARFLPGLGQAIGLAAGAWMLYDFWQQSANDSSKKAAELYNSNVVKTLQDQTAKLKAINDLREEGLSLSEAQARVDALAKKQEALDPFAKSVNDAIKKEMQERAKLDALKEEASRYAAKDNLAKVKEQEAVVNRAAAATQAAKAKEVQAVNEVTTAIDKQVAEVKRAAEFDKRDTEERAERLKQFGTGTFSLAGGAGAGGPMPRVFDDRYIQELQKQTDSALSLLKDRADREQAILANKNKNLLISDAEYMAKSISASAAYSQESINILEQQLKKQTEIRKAEQAELNKELAKQTPGSDGYRKLKTEIDKRNNEQVTAEKATSDKITKIREDSFLEQEKRLQDIEGATRKLSKAEEDFWAKAANADKKSDQLYDLERQYKNINTSIFSSAEAEKAYAEAVINSNAAYEDRADAIKREIGQRKENIAWLIEQIKLVQKSADLSTDPVAKASYDELSAVLKRYKADLAVLEKIFEDGQADAAKRGAERGAAAYKKVMDAKAYQMVSGIADAIETALFEGGKVGGQKLWDMLQQELLRKPLRAVIQAFVSDVFGLTGGTGSGVGGAVGAASNISSAYSLINNGLNVAGQSGKWLSTKGTELALQWGGEAAGTLVNNFALGMSSTSSMSAASAALQGTGSEIAGLAVGSLMNGFAGYGISNFLSGGYSAGGWINTAAGIASAIPGVGPIAGAVGGLVNRAFGRKHEQTNLQGTFGGTAGFEGRWEDYYKGGWFSSGKSVYTPLDEGTRSALATQFNTMRFATAAMADVLGLGTDAITNFTASVNVKLKGLSAEDAQKAIQAEFDKIAESLASTVLGTTEFSRVGETAVQTLSRLSSSLSTVNNAFDLLNIEAQGTQFMAGLAGGNNASNYLDKFGGADAFNTLITNYYDAFYSEAEKTANTIESITKTLAQFGIAVPATREEFRALTNQYLAMGDAGATVAAALLGVSGAFASVVDASGNVSDAISETMKRLQSETKSLEIELLRAQGSNQAADALQRAIDTEGMSQAEIAIYNYNQGLRDQIKAIEDAAAAAEKYKAFRSSLIDLESRFEGGGFSRLYKSQEAASQVVGLLDSVGIKKDLGQVTDLILNATVDDVTTYFREIWDVLPTDDAKQQLIDVTNAMLDIATGAGSLTDAYQKQKDKMAELASEVSRLFSARNDAGNLLDKIAGAMGNQGTFGTQRESELWGALDRTEDYEKQVELAGQLTDLVIARQQLEVQNAQKLLDFGKNLRSYVDGLMTGSLSPLTNTNKLAEAASQFNSTLASARSGDTDAQSKLQNISSEYLSLAQEYYAGNAQYTAIFNTVTSSLNSLGVTSMSSAEQQLSVGTQSLSELQKLYSITENAYLGLNRQYEAALSELESTQNALVLQADSLEQLKEISGVLDTLPAEIAVRLPTINMDGLLQELQMLRAEVSLLREENRQDAQMQANVTMQSSAANAAQISQSTEKAAYITTVKQGAVLV